MVVTKHSLHIETRGDVSVLICSSCKRPLLTIKAGTMVIDSRHGSATHTNTLTASHLKMLIVEMARQLQPDIEHW